MIGDLGANCLMGAHIIHGGQALGGLWSLDPLILTSSLSRPPTSMSPVANHAAVVRDAASAAAAHIRMSVTRLVLSSGSSF